MSQEEVNPYESPRTVDAEATQRTSSPLVRAVIRCFAMGLIGFVSFSAVGLLYLVIAEYFELEIFPSIAWALGVGGIGAAIFFSSELFNSRNGKKASFLSRFAVALVIFFVSMIGSSSITTLLGWTSPHSRSEQDDPYWIHNLLTFCGVLIGALFTVRWFWIDGQDAGQSE